MTALHPKTQDISSDTAAINPWAAGDHAMLSHQPVTVVGINGTRCEVQRVDEDDLPLPDVLPETVSMNALSPRKQWPDAPAEAPILYPIDSTAYSASLLVRVTIKKVRHDRRQVEWVRDGDPRPFSNWFGLNELSDSDDPYTRTTLGQDEPSAFDEPTVEGFTESERNPALPQEGVNLFLMTLPDDHPMATASYAEKKAYFAKAKTPDQPALSDSSTESALIGWTRAKMAVTGQTPTITLHPADPLTIDQAGESTIAQEEISFAQAMNELGQKLQQRDATIKALEAERDALKTDNESLKKSYRNINARMIEMEAQMQGGADDDNGYLEHLIMESNAELNSRIKALEQQLAGPQRRKIETVMLVNPTMNSLASEINEGWRVVFETITSDSHTLRLEREIVDPATPPQDAARAALTVSMIDTVPTEAIAETPDESGVVIEQPAAIVFHVTPMMTPSYEPIDPAEIDMKMPLYERLSKYGPEANIAADNLAIVNAMTAVKRHYEQQNAQQPIRTLMQAIHQHA